jgi:hypothetical protein
MEERVEIASSPEMQMAPPVAAWRFEKKLF